MSAFTADCETRTISGSRSTLLDLVVGKLAADENLFDKNSKRTHPTLSVPYSQTKVRSTRVPQPLDLHFTESGDLYGKCHIYLNLFALGKVGFRLSQHLCILLFEARESQKPDRQKYMSLKSSFHKLFESITFRHLRGIGKTLS